MKVGVIGTRGFPGVQGGVETHCQQLYPILAEMGMDITVFTRCPYIIPPRKTVWKKVKFKHLWCPRIKSIEAISHTALALIYARLMGITIVHIHAIGPALLVPLAKLLGFKVVLTHHGPDYDRQKWNRFAKAVLRLGETVGCRFADEIIAISKGICDIIGCKVGRTPRLIYNGVQIPQRNDSTAYLQTLDLAPGKYILAVARFVPEKGLHDLISAYSDLKSDWKLVIAGDADHETSYSRQLKSRSLNNSNIVLTGFISGDNLKEIYSHAGLFVLPSYHEGLPIALLEALSYGIPVLVSDIAPNKEVELGQDKYFPVGNTNALADKLNYWVNNGNVSNEDRCGQIEMIRQRYNWDTIADQIRQTYKEVLVAGR